MINSSPPASHLDCFLLPKQWEASCEGGKGPNVMCADPCPLCSKCLGTSTPLVRATMRSPRFWTAAPMPETCVPISPPPIAHPPSLSHSVPPITQLPCTFLPGVVRAHSPLPCMRRHACRPRASVPRPLSVPCLPFSGLVRWVKSHSTRLACVTTDGSSYLAIFSCAVQSRAGRPVLLISFMPWSGRGVCPAQIRIGAQGEGEARLQQGDSRREGWGRGGVVRRVATS